MSVHEFFSFAWLEPLILTYGLWVMFIVLTLESMGLPLPGESALVATALYAGSTGQFSIFTVVLIGALAAIIGDNAGYWLGRRIGFPLVERYGGYVRLTSERIELGRSLFARHGRKIVFFGRFVAFLRIFAAVLAGAWGMAWRDFLIMNVAGAFVWASVFGFGAYLLGDRISHIAGPLGIAAAVGVVLFLIGAFFFLRWQEHRLMAQARRDAGE